MGHATGALVVEKLSNFLEDNEIPLSILKIYPLKKMVQMLIKLVISFYILFKLSTYRREDHEKVERKLGLLYSNFFEHIESK